jgi:hypothetical protein
MILCSPPLVKPLSIKSPFSKGGFRGISREFRKLRKRQATVPVASTILSIKSPFSKGGFRGISKD